MHKLFDHDFKSIAAIERGNYVLPFIISTLKSVNKAEQILISKLKKEEVENILDANTIYHCLYKCKSFIEGDKSLSDTDYQIYFNHAAIKAKEADEILQSITECQ